MDLLKDISEVTDELTQNNSETSQEEGTESEKKTTNYVFTDEDRQKAIEVRQAKDAAKIQEINQQREISRFNHLLAMEQLRTQAIELRMQRQEMREIMNKPANNESEDSMLSSLIDLAKIFISNQQANKSSQSPAVTASPQIQTRVEQIAAAGDLSDADIEAYVSKVPQILLDRARADTDEHIKMQLIQYKPDLNDSSIKRIIARIRR
jgi:hypothetical protein